MFGLGWMELLIIVGAIMLIAGPVAGPKLIKSLRSLLEARSGLSGATGLTKLLEIDKTIESIAEKIDPKEEPEDGDT